MIKININDNIFYVGSNDRRKHLFENNWPLPYGVSYNSYLINDCKSALIDTVEFGSDDHYISNIKEILGGKSLDYLIVNHMEPDHSSMINAVLTNFPKVKVVGNAQTFKLLKAFYNLNEESFLCIKDGDVLDLGKYKLQFALVPWVHWPETMVTYEQVTGTLFSCDAFGGFGTLDGSIFDDGNDFQARYKEEMLRYYSNIVAKYSNMVQKAFNKLSGLKINTIAPSHGLIWRKNPGIVLDLYNKWSNYYSEKGVVIVYASMYGNTAQMADYIGKLLGSKGIEVVTFDVSKTHVSYILSQIWKYKAVVLGTCAYNTQMHPMMEHLCNEIKLSAPKNKILSIFGSSSWNGAGVKALLKFAQENNFEVKAPVLEVLGAPTTEKMEEGAIAMVNSIIEQLNA